MTGPVSVGAAPDRVGRKPCPGQTGQTSVLSNQLPVIIPLTKPCAGVILVAMSPKAAKFALFTLIVLSVGVAIGHFLL